MDEIDQIINKYCSENVNTWMNLEFANLGKRLSFWKRLRAYMYRKELKTRIIRPNDLVTMGVMLYSLYRYCMTSGNFRLMGINWTKFVTVRSEPNGNLVIEWV